MVVSVYYVIIWQMVEVALYETIYFFCFDISKYIETNQFKHIH